MEMCINKILEYYSFETCTHAHARAHTYSMSLSDLRFSWWWFKLSCGSKVLWNCGIHPHHYMASQPTRP